MIKTKFQKYLLLVVLLATLSFCVVALTLPENVKTVNATDITFEQEISQNYALGDSFAPPSAKITYEGQDYNAYISSLTFPDGKSYKANSYVLSIPGKYFVNYTAKAGTNLLTSSVSFSVSANSYFVSSSNSSAYYGSINNTDANGEKKTVDGEDVTTSGIIVSLSAGDTFTYKKPINLYGKTKLDNILTLYSLPEILGKADARILNVRLTDAYDENNYVDIVTFGNYGDEDEVRGWALYSGAAANGQPLTGLHFWAAANERTFTYQGQLYTHNTNLSYNSANGYPSYEYSLAAKDGYGQRPYALSMDYAEKQLFGCKTIASSSNGMIVDLDEPLFFDNLWQGFTTGEVYLSISADNYVGSSFKFIVTNILDEDISKNTFEDKVAPKLDVDAPKTIPSAIIGKDYKIFDAVALDDVDGETQVSALVYSNYASSNPVMVNVVNGMFSPKKASVYTIVYKAVDRAGNVQIVSIDVPAKAQSELSVDFTASQEDAIAGEVISLAKPIVSGNDGDYELTVSVALGSEKTVILPDENGDYNFLAMKAGVYTVEYSVVDYNNSVSKTYDLTVQANSVLTFVSDVYLPPVFVNGVEYVLPSLNGYDLSGANPQEVNAKIYYSFDGGQFVQYTEGSKLKITASQSVKIKYSLSEQSVDKEYLIDVVDVGISEQKYNRSKYFYGKDFEINAEDKSVSYTSNSQNPQLTFINKLLVTDFSLKYQFKDADFKSVIFTLKDYSDASKILTVALRAKDEGSYYISINGKQESIISKSIKDSNKLAYKDDEKVLLISGLEFDVSDFAGLDSKLAWLEISFVENTYVNFIVSEINGQQMTSAVTDNAAPVYSIKINNDEKTVGEELIISRFIACDVLKFNSICKLTIKGPDNNPVVTVDGVTMKDVTDFSVEHVIKINSLGKYSITGSVSDGARITSINREVSVKDNVAPTITLSDIKYSAKTGDVKIASYDINDNGGSVFVTICVQCPNMMVVSVSNNKFRAEEKGVYTVMFFATDETGNVGFASYEVVVK